MFDRCDGISLRTGFLKNASVRPDASAVAVRGATLSYGQLEETARRWANAIVGVSRDKPERVGLFAYRSNVSYCGTLAALFSGAAFVPLNPSFPSQKTRSMIQQAGLDAIIVDKMCAPLLSEVLLGLDSPPLLMPEFESFQIPGVDLRVLRQRDLSSTATLLNLPALNPEDIAYILFTSGST